MGLPQQPRTECQVIPHGDGALPDHDAKAWIVSLLFHLLLLVIVGVITIYRPHNQVTLTLTAPMTMEDVVDLDPEVFHFSREETELVGSQSVRGSTAALSVAPEIAEVSEVPMLETPIMELGPIEIQDLVARATGAEFGRNFSVKGSVGAATSGADGAVDRITLEILSSLEERATLVVWLFDQSGSLERQRQAIHDRFQRIYAELGVIQADGHRSFEKHASVPLLSAVVAFGEQVLWMTQKPTDDVEQLKEAVAAIGRDESGVENVFHAVAQTADKYRRFRSTRTANGSPLRNVMIVVFTDEIGDDHDWLDKSVQLCRRNEMPVYVVGVPAPFGRQQTMVKWVDPDPSYDQTPRWGPVNQGPESLYPERLRLSFSGRNDRNDALDSGFGPYALTRLCYETGGIYFAAHPNRTTDGSVGRHQTAAFSAYIQRFFDPRVMRKYRPDYVAVEQHNRQLKKNPLRASLVKAAQLSWVTPMENSPRRFVRRSEPELAGALTEAQKNAAKIEPKIDSIYQTLRLGEGARERERALRWLAGYDLAMGRSLAVKVRTESYNYMLAEGKRGMKFEDEGNNTWVLEPDNEVTAGSQLKNLGAKAREYLTRVVRQHPNTPWAYLAERELRQPVSWRWTETFTDLAPRRPGSGGGGNPRPPSDDRPVVLNKPKPRRPVPKL